MLLGLSLLLLLVGGGFGAPLLGVLLSIGLLRAVRVRPLLGSPGTVRRALGRRWRQLLILTVSSFLALFPGVILLSWWTGLDSLWLPSLLPAVAFTGLVFTLVAALAQDRAKVTSTLVER